MASPVEKTEYILDRCQGKSVLHIGCTCYPNTATRLESDSFLHKRLSEVAGRLHGIDVDHEG
jgi:hypothetical protein